jgi:hypothetical protein
MLLLLDLSILSAHLTIGLVPPGAHGPTSVWNLAMERGVSEVVEYGKTLACAGLIAWVAVRTRQTAFTFFACLYFVAFLDNAFELHERTGDQGARFGLSDHIAQFVLLAAFAVTMLAAAVAATLRTDAAYRPAATALLALFALLAFFSVVLDALQLPTIVEDGGELVVLSLHLFAASLLVGGAGRTPATRGRDAQARPA